MPRIHRSRHDSRMNPVLRDQVGELRGTMLDAAERFPMAPGFALEPTDRQSVRIVHQDSGRSYEVSLYAYGATRKAFSELFPDGMQATFGKGVRFEVRGLDGACEIHDGVTDRKVEVPLYALREVIEAAKVIGDDYMTEKMRFEASLDDTIELAGATLSRAPYPSNDDPAYRIVDDGGDEIGYVHYRRSHWAVIDFERFGKDDPERPERIEFAEKRSLHTALAYVESVVAKRVLSPSP